MATQCLREFSQWRQSQATLTGCAAVFSHAWATSKTLKYSSLGFYWTVCMQNRWQCFFWGGLRRRQFVPTTADHFPRRRLAWTTEKYVASVSMLKQTEQSTVWKLCHLKSFVCFPIPCLFHTHRDWFWGCLRKRAMFNCQRQLHVSTKLCLANCLNCSKCKSPLCPCMLSRCLVYGTDYRTGRFMVLLLQLHNAVGKHKSK